ncbi:MAG: hypothetical protein ACOYM3_30460 [Terrimicrobiaceae bacterium]
MRTLWQDLQPAPDRLGGTLRITFSAVLVALVMLTFRMPFLYIGPYLVFILSQRDTFLTRAAAALGIGVAVAASLIIYLVAWLAWDTGWLRVSLWGLIFFGGYFFMRVCVEPRAVLGPLVVVALFAFAFDEVPDPNRVVSLVGWLWAILGLIIVATFLAQWFFRAPTAIELLRRQFRELLIAVEQVYLSRAYVRTPPGNRMNFEEEETASRIEKLGTAGVLAPAQARCTLALMHSAFRVLRPIPTGKQDRPTLLAFAAWTRRLRRRILLGVDVPPTGPSPDTSGLDPAMQEASGKIQEAALLMEKPGVPEVEKKSVLIPDWKSNPAYTDFALRATLATMACYLFMSLTDWDGIHTCLITCAVTALAGADAQTRKQNLRMTGALIGGILGMGAVIFLIPRMDSLAAYLAILASGTAAAAWISLGSERISYAGWQIALAFYMTVLQDPHPTTKLDIIRDRWVGIFIGILAMRAAFVWWAPHAQPLPAAAEQERILTSGN